MTAIPSIEHEETAGRGRYFTAMPNGEEARLTYVRTAPGRIVADHTFVPVPYRDEGIGERLVAQLVADAREKGAKITPACWFVAAELERMSPQWDDVWDR